MATKMSLERDKTIRFGLKGLSRITHEDILKSLVNIVPQQDIHGIQLTRSECFLTFKTVESKLNVLIQGVNVGENFVKPTDVDKTVTNVTIKDLPVELSDEFVASSLMKYGEVVNGSLRRGFVKGTQIETGTRYCQMLNVENPIPNLTNFGDHLVRIFCDNEKTLCKYCNLGSHPFYKCPLKRDEPKRCYRCKSDLHLVRDCPNTVCDFCGVEGHKKYDCSAFLEQVNRDRQGLLNMVRSPNAKENRPTEDKPTAVTHSTPVPGKGEPYPTEPDSTEQKITKVVFGASNCCGLEMNDPNCVVIAESGISAENIEQLFDKTKECKAESIKTVIIHLGTNDLKQTRNDSDVTAMRMMNAVSLTMAKFKNLDQVGVASVPPKRGKGNEHYNSTVRNLNTFMRKFCEKTCNVQYIDNDPIFMPKGGHPAKVMFNKDDQSCIHFSPFGRHRVVQNFRNFLNPPEGFVCVEKARDSNKRGRNDLSATPPSAEKQCAKKSQPDDLEANGSITENLSPIKPMNEA